MSESYAKALCDLAEEKNQLGPIHSDVDAVGILLKVRHPAAAAGHSCEERIPLNASSCL